MSTREQAALILAACASSEGYPFILDAAITFGASVPAFRLAQAAWWYAAAYMHDCDETYAEAECLLRTGWRP